MTRKILCLLWQLRTRHCANVRDPSRITRTADERAVSFGTQIGDHMAAAVAVTTALTAAGLGSAVLASRRAADHDRAASKR